MLLLSIASPATSQQLASNSGISSQSVDALGLSARAKYAVTIINAPREVRIGNVSSKNCRDRVSISVRGPRLQPGDSLAASIDFRLIGVEPTQTADFREDLKPGRIYRVFPYAEPESGSNYKVTFCGAILGRVNLYSAALGKYEAEMKVTLYRSVSVRWTELASDTVSFRVNWRGQSG